MARESLITRRNRIRSAVEELPPGPMRRYPARLRMSIASYARAYIADGGSQTRVCAELGVSPPTLSRLLDDARPTLRPVRVIEAAEPARAVVGRGPGIVIEGLYIEGAAALLRGLA